MKIIDIEKLPDAVNGRKISKKQGADIIWEDIYMKPQHYGLLSMNEDQRSDFLLEIHENFEKLFDKFTPGLSPFRAFISGCVAQYKMAFLRKQGEEKYARENLMLQLKGSFDSETEKYNITVADDKGCSVDLQKSFSDIAEQETGNSMRRDRRIAELTALILALKACNEIDDSTINNVCSFTGIKRELFQEAIQSLKQTSSKRNYNFNRLIKKRNNSYFFHRKYLHEMLTSSPNGIRHESLRKRYETQTERWKKLNMELTCHNNSPSNKDIAGIIGIKTRTVSFYINHARSSIHQKKMQEFYQGKSPETEKPDCEEKAENEITENDSRLKGSDFV